MQMRNDIRSEFSILINWNLKKPEEIEGFNGIFTSAV